MCIINVGRYTNPMCPSWENNLHEVSQSFRPVTRIKSVWRKLWLLWELSLMCFGREKSNGYANNAFHLSNIWQELMMNIPLKVSLGYLNAKILNIPLLQIVHPFNWWAYVHFNSQPNGWLSPFLIRHFPTWKYIRPAWCTFWLMKWASRFGQGWLYSVREKLCPSSIWNEQEFIPWQTLQVEECLNSSPEIHLKTSMEAIEIH